MRARRDEQPPPLRRGKTPPDVVRGEGEADGSGTADARHAAIVAEIPEHGFV